MNNLMNMMQGQMPVDLMAMMQSQMAGHMAGKGKGGKSGGQGGKSSPGGPPKTAIVRYDNPGEAQFAAEKLNGSYINDTQIQVILDPASKDVTRVKVANIPSEAEWQEIKDHFRTAGQVAFVDIGGKGGGKGVPGGPVQAAVVRYDDMLTANNAVEQLNGSYLLGGQIEVVMDPLSKDFTRVKVNGIPSEAAWQEVKDHFNQVGRVAFADIVPGGNSPVGGTVRYFTTEEALNAIQQFNGSDMGGHTIEVKMHSGTKDQTKIQIFGMPPGTEWQEVKDHFGQIGQIAFAEAYDPSVALTGYIRYDDPAHAQLAVNMLNGTMLGGAPISIELDYASRDMSKLIIHGIPAGIEWQELKDHFKNIGTVAYSDVKGGKGKGKDKDKGGMFVNPANMMQMLTGMMQVMSRMEWPI
jgi:RNA recognition motif-containing protein